MSGIPHTRPAAQAQSARLISLKEILHRLALRRERARLAQLDDHILADIGISRDQALAEASRPVWDAPQHWRA
jgi:uncharacterized protein YjiS (DUF1127 family)